MVLVITWSLECRQRIDSLALSEVKLTVEGLCHILSGESEIAGTIWANIFWCLNGVQLVIWSVKVPVDCELKVFVSTIIENLLVQDIFWDGEDLNVILINKGNIESCTENCISKEIFCSQVDVKIIALRGNNIP